MSTPIVPPLPFDRLNAEWSPVACIKHEAAQLYADLFRARFPGLASRCNGRIERAVEICARPGACRRAEGYPAYVFAVQSESNKSPAAFYLVDLKAKTCTCPDSGKGNLCKHRLAVGFHIYGPDWSAEANAERISRVYDARSAMEKAWKIAIEQIDIWESAATTLHADGTYASESDLEPLRVAMTEALEIAHAAQDAYNNLVNPK